MSALSDDLKAALDVRAALLAAGISEDDPDLAELMDGECDAIDRLRRILRFSRWTEAQAKALGELMAESRERKARMERKADSLRGVVLHALSELGLKRLDAPDFSATVAAGKRRVLITDEAALPDDVCVFRREPSKTAIAEWLAEKPCPGAEMSNGAPSLTVRVK